MGLTSPSPSGVIYTVRAGRDGQAQEARRPGQATPRTRQSRAKEGFRLTLRGVAVRRQEGTAGGVVRRVSEAWVGLSIKSRLGSLQMQGGVR